MGKLYDYNRTSSRGGTKHSDIGDAVQRIKAALEAEKATRPEKPLSHKAPTDQGKGK